MENKFFYLDGTEIPAGKGIRQVDHIETVFIVRVRHMGNVREETIKDLIEKKFEVANISATHQDVYALC